MVLQLVLGIQLVYNAKDFLSLIELTKEASPTWNGFPVFGLPFRDVIKRFEDIGITFSKPFDRSMYLCLDKGIGLYVPLENKIESFSLFCKGYYDEDL